MACLFPCRHLRQALVFFHFPGIYWHLWLHRSCQRELQELNPRIFRQQLSKLSNGKLPLCVGVQLKCQALKQTNTDNKEGNNVLKLGSRESSVNLEHTRLLPGDSNGWWQEMSSRQVSLSTHSQIHPVILSTQAASFSFTALRNSNPSRGQKAGSDCPPAKNREKKQNKRAGFKNPDGELHLHRPTV